MSIPWKRTSFEEFFWAVPYLQVSCSALDRWRFLVDLVVHNLPGKNPSIFRKEHRKKGLLVCEEHMRHLKFEAPECVFVINFGDMFLDPNMPTSMAFDEVSGPLLQSFIPVGFHPSQLMRSEFCPPRSNSVAQALPPDTCYSDG